MSALSRIRNNITLVVIVIGIALVAFILTDLLSSGGGQIQGVSELGSVAGTTIGRREFSERYDRYRASYPNINDVLAQNLQDQVWNEMVGEIALDKEFDNVGLKISGEEIYDMFTGKDIHPVVRQYFVQPGQEPDPNQIAQQLQTLLDSEEGAAQLKPFEDYLARERGRERLANMFKSGFLSSKEAARILHQQQNRKVDIEFLTVNYSSIPDSAVSVTDSDLRSYIAARPKAFEQDDATYIKYVSIPVTPSPEDSAKIYQNMLRQRTLFAEAVNDSLYMVGKNRAPLNQSYRSINLLNESVRDSVRGATPNTVIGPVQEFNYYRLYKLKDVKQGEDAYVKLNHILIRPAGNTPADTVAARQKAREIAREANNSNFVDLVNEHSQDFASKNNGGSLNWYGPTGMYGEGFYDRISGLSQGSVTGPIQSPQGFHIVQILDKSNEEYQLAEIEEEITYGNETQKVAYTQINTLADRATNLTNDIEEAAKEQDLSVRESTPLSKDVKYLPGMQGGRDLILWAIDASVGDFSEVFSIGDNFVFAEVSAKQQAGLQSVEDVRDQVTREVINEKKAEMIIAQLQAGDDLQAIKEAYGDQAIIRTATGVSFASGTIPAMGSEPFVVGRISALQAGEVSEPIKGTNGVFVVKATNVTEASEVDDATLAARAKTDAATGQTNLTNKLQPLLVELADVQDNRHKAGY